MEQNTNVHENRSDAHRRLNRALGHADGIRPGDLLGAATRTLVVKQMALPDTARSLLGLRQTSTHRLWRALVKRCADSPRAVGFMRVEGGLRGLAAELGVDHTTLSRSLKAWETRHPPLVATGYEQRSRARESLALIQIPLLTEWLLWTADARARWLSHLPGVAGDRQIVDIQRAYIPRGMPPSSDITWEGAAELLRPASEVAGCGEDVLTGVDLLNRQRLQERLEYLREKRWVRFGKIRRKGYERREARRRISA